MHRVTPPIANTARWRLSTQSPTALLTVAWLAFLLAGCQIPPPVAPPEESVPVTVAAPLPDASPIAEVRTVESRPIEGRNPINTRGWKTDFTKRTIDLTEIISGGPPKDGIPSLDAPRFEPIATAADWLTDTDPVIVYEHGGQARAYPLAVLIWHEIVNDEIAGRPVTVTFCPLCNASVVFDRRVGDMVLDFGTTGSLRHSDLVMYDRQTETWWQQFTGAALIGELASTQLTFLPSQVLGFGRFRELFPEGEVLQRPLDQFSRNYGMNPYVNYDTYGNGLSRNENLVLFTGEPDPRLKPLDRVVGVLFPDHSSVAIPFDLARARTVVHYDPPNGDPGIVVFFEEGMSSSLSEAEIGTARDIGSVGVFSRVLDGRHLEFDVADDGTVRDAQTGSTWNIRGEATAGELQGSALEAQVAFDHFWFAWAEFLPDTELVAVD
ncbi:MAG: DUF3179 domain-containing protein [Caldilineaceae bacterium SB0666_bin_21]|nr:DUF3179 domain-containing protein [Caldilineaceae bacterium SB0666_bin_21]